MRSSGSSISSVVPTSRVETDLNVALNPSVFFPTRRSILLVEPDKRAAADEEDVRGVDLENSWCGCFRPPCGGTFRDGSLENLQQRLLNAFSRDVARDPTGSRLAADLVDFVDVR